MTVGLKSRDAAGRLQFNPELFLYDYRDLLIQSHDVSAAYNPIFNARRVRIWSAQVDLRYLPGAAAFDLRVGYTHARNRDFTTPDGSRHDGLALAYAPDWALSAGYPRSAHSPRARCSGAWMRATRASGGPTTCRTGACGSARR